MKKETIVGIIAIAAIVAVVIFAGCIESTTKIKDLNKHPDNYIGKSVTIEAKLGSASVPYFGPTTYCNLRGFWIHEEGSRPDVVHSIFVNYDGDVPPARDEWGGWSTGKTVRVMGIVDWTYVGPKYLQQKDLYIDGESWEYID